MSEQMNTQNNRCDFRKTLLTTASMLALLASAFGLREAEAADVDSDSPALWIELGGQFERVDAGEQPFVPFFSLGKPQPAFETISPLDVERPPRYSLGTEGKIAFQPFSTDWILSASALYGRSNRNEHVRQQTHPAYVPFLFGSIYPAAAKFADTNAQSDESHFILDFQAGKDVGFGMFGSKSSSTLSLGVRFAQFGAKSNVILKSDPDWQYKLKYNASHHKSIAKGQYYHNNNANVGAARSFHGIGPSISWNASAPAMGNPQNGEIALDWGLNAALLFGRQKATTHHQSSSSYNKLVQHKYNGPTILSQSQPTPRHSTRARFVTVPNLGGFAGITFRRSIAKVSFGYRGDFFFGAMDGGIDAAKKENVGFYGPFANISVGLGG